MNEQHDDMKRLVKGILNDGTASGTGWDEPSDSVWTGISGKLQQRRRRRGIIWLALLGVVSLGVLAYSMFPPNEEPPATDATNETSTAAAPHNTQNDLSTTADLQELTETSDTRDRDLESAGAEAEAFHPTIETTAEFVGKTTGSAATGDHTAKPGTHGANKTTDALPELPVEANPASAAAERTEADDARSATIGTSADRPEIMLTTLDGLMSSVEFSGNPETPSPTAPAMTRQASRWTVSAFTGPSFGTRHIAVGANQPRLARVLLQQHEMPEVSLTYGASLRYAVNSRWDIGVGIEYVDLQMRSHYKKQIRYSQAGETVNPDGHFESSYQVNFNSSYGRIETDIVVERQSDAAIPQYDFIGLDFRMDQTLRFVRIPVFARYKFNVGRLRVHTLTGLTLQHLQRSGIDIRMVQSLDQDVQRVRTIRPGMRGARRTTTGVQFGIGAEFPVNERFILSAMPTLSASLDPVYDNGIYKVFPYTFDLRIGMTYRL